MLCSKGCYELHIFKSETKGAPFNRLYFFMPFYGKSVQSFH